MAFGCLNSSAMQNTRYFTALERVLTRTDADAAPFVVSSEGVRTFGDFAVAVNNFKRAFLASGAQRIAVFHPDIFELAVRLFGCWCAGVTAVLPADTSEDICRRLNEIVDGFSGDFPAAQVPEVIAPLEGDAPCRDTIDPSQPHIALFTSGSTGEPTLVVKRLSQLFCEVASIDAGGHGLREELADDVLTLATVPAQHIYGLLFTLLLPLAARRPVWHERILYPEELVERIARCTQCIVVATPAHLKRLPAHLPWQRTVGRIAALYSSGGPLSEEGLLNTWRLTGITPVEIFGSSESGGIASRQRRVEVDGSITATAYRPLPGIEWRIESDLLVIRSPQLSSNGWETTNDRVRLCEDGTTFELLGRADRIVKIEEKRVSLTQLEAALETTPWVEKARVFVRDAARGRLAAVCIPTIEGVNLIVQEGKSALTHELRAHLAKHVERVCLPRYWRFTWEMPENTMGKQTQAALETLFDARAPQAVLQSSSPNKARIALSVAADCVYFEGHFPDFAILPGLTQITWVEQLAERLFGTHGFAGLKALKFVRPIRPDSTVLLELQKTDAGVAFVYSTTDGHPYSRGTLILSQEVRC